MALLVASLGAPGAALGQTVWTGGLGAVWSDNASWVGGVAPTSSNTTFVEFGTGTVAIVDAPWTLNRMNFLTPFTITGTTLTFSGAAPRVDTAGGTAIILNSIVLDTTTVFSTGSLLRFSGPLSGTGGLTKDGADNLQLESVTPITYSGTTTVNSGALVVGPVIASVPTGGINRTGRLVPNGGQFDTGGSTFGSLAGTGGTINVNSGTLTVGGDNASTTFDGQILTGGAGDFTKVGTGTLTLSSSAPRPGGTVTISAGTLEVGNGAALALSGTFNGAVVNNGTLRVNNGAGGFFVQLNDLSGTGSLVKDGTGTLTSSGPTWTHSGITTVNAGTLAASINSTGRLVMNGGTFDTGGSTFGSIAGTAGTFNINSGTLAVGGDNSSTTFGGSFGGPGTLAKNGTGTLTLTGTSTHSGPLQLNGGTQVLNGTTASAVTLASGTLMGGAGTVGALTANAGGTVAPGNSIGTLTVNGALTFNPGST